MNNREIRTRVHDAPLFKIRTPRCEDGKRSIGYFRAEGWNTLTPILSNSESYREFKKLQKVNMLLPLKNIA